MEIMDVNTEDCVTAPRNSDFQEHSRNLLESAAGEELELVSEQRSLKQVLDSELHSNASEYREHSQNRGDNGKPTDVETPGKLVKRTFSRTCTCSTVNVETFSKLTDKQAAGVAVIVSAEDTKCLAANSDFLKDSQNSLSSDERKMDDGEAQVLLGIVMVIVWWWPPNPRTFSKLAGGNGKFRSCTEEATH